MVVHLKQSTTNWKQGDTWFTCQTPWKKVAAGFKEEFMGLWPTPKPHETSFFQKWSFLGLVTRAQQEISKANEWHRREPAPPVPTKGGGFIPLIPQAHFRFTRAEKARLFMFEHLAGNYRVFAVPHRLLTKQDAETAFELLCSRRAWAGAPG